MNLLLVDFRIHHFTVPLTADGEKKKLRVFVLFWRELHKALLALKYLHEFQNSKAATAFIKAIKPKIFTVSDLDK